MQDATQIFKRHEGGPLLHIKDFPGKAQIYNPAPVQCGDETILLVSVVVFSFLFQKNSFVNLSSQTYLIYPKDCVLEVWDQKRKNIIFVQKNT